MKRVVRNILFSTYLMLVCIAAFGQLPIVTVTGVALDNDSCKVQYKSVAGAQDYRIIDQAAPTKCKYAGDIHPTVGGKVTTTPALEIEQNGVTPGTAHTYVIEAVDQMGPFPQANLVDINNKPIYTPMPGMAAMLGSNAGATSDGMTSTNGQGDWADSPNVIGRSAPFTVTIPRTALGIPGATQVHIDDFQSATLSQTSHAPTLSTFDMITPSMGWDVRETNCHDATSIFVMNRHLMDVAFDGGNQPPLHTQYGIVSFSPKTTATLAPGEILHVTFEVDGHLDTRRSIVLNLSPADDPITGWQTINQPVNKTNTGVFITIDNSKHAISQCVGSKPNGLADVRALFGAAGQAKLYNARKVNGRGLDNRSRFDLLTSSTHFILLEDGVNVCEGDWFQPLPLNLKVFFVHYLYHTWLESQEVKKYTPWETYWLNTAPWFDERHWDNMGFEVLPFGTTFASASAMIKPMAFTLPLP